MLSTALPFCLHCYRFLHIGSIALLVTLLSIPQARGLEIYATSIFPPDQADPDPALNGVLKVDLDTGNVSTFIPEIYAGQQPVFAFSTDVAVNPINGDIYVSTLLGSIMRFDNTGTPLPSTITGFPPGTFAFLETVQFGDAYSSLHFDDNGTLYAGTYFASITSFDTSTGSVISNQSFDTGPVTGLSQAPSGELIITAGGNPETGTPSSIYNLDGESLTLLVSSGASPSVRSGSNPTVVEAPGDYDGSGVVDAADYDVWVNAYGTFSPEADGNFDGFVDAADYTIWRDSIGDQTKILVSDLHANAIMSFNLDGSGGEVFAVIPPDIPNPLPPTANPSNPSNSPSEILVTPDGTLLVSTLGLTQRPDNRGAILEFDLEGNLLQTISVNTNAGALPPISGIDFVPIPVVGPPINVPEPAGILLIVSMIASTSFCRRSPA